MRAALDAGKTVARAARRQATRGCSSSTRLPTSRATSAWATQGIPEPLVRLPADCPRRDRLRRGARRRVRPRRATARLRRRLLRSSAAAPFASRRARRGRLRRADSSTRVPVGAERHRRRRRRHRVSRAVDVAMSGSSASVDARRAAQDGVAHGRGSARDHARDPDLHRRSPPRRRRCWRRRSGAISASRPSSSASSSASSTRARWPRASLRACSSSATARSACRRCACCCAPRASLLVPPVRLTLPGATVLALAVAPVIIGVGYGPITPASSQILARTAHPSRMALTFSIKQTGVPAGRRAGGRGAADPRVAVRVARGVRAGRGAGRRRRA